MTSFLEALKNQPTTTAPVTRSKSPEPIVSVELVTNRNRIDVFFSVKPNQDILDDLKLNHFKYRPSDRAWYTYDNRIQRSYLAHKFNLPELIDSPAPYNEQPYAPVSTDEKQFDTAHPSPSIELIQPEGSAEYVKFKQQTNELLAELKIDAADLMLLAIDTLHKKTFNNH